MVFLFKRLISFLPVTFAVVFLVGTMIHAIPGDPVDIIAGDYATEQTKQEMRKQLGLDRPLLEQVTHYYLGIFHGDLGTSIVNQRPVTTLLGERALPTLELTVCAILLSIFTSLPIGLACAIWPRSILSRLFTGLSFAGAAMPNFWLGPLLVLFFSISLGWFPVSGRTTLTSLVLPVLALSTSLIPILIRMIKLKVGEQIREDYVRTARAKGLGEFPILMKHVLRNASIPITTILGMQFGALITGAIITEKVFDWPGLGTLIAEAIDQRDYPVVQGCVFVFSLAFLTTTLITDLIYAQLDPRIRL